MQTEGTTRGMHALGKDSMQNKELDVGQHSNNIFKHPHSLAFIERESGDQQWQISDRIVEAELSLVWPLPEARE